MGFSHGLSCAIPHGKVISGHSHTPVPRTGPSQKRDHGRVVLPLLSRNFFNTEKKRNTTSITSFVCLMMDILRVRRNLKIEYTKGGGKFAGSSPKLHPEVRRV